MPRHRPCTICLILAACPAATAADLVERSAAGALEGLDWSLRTAHTGDTPLLLPSFDSARQAGQQGVPGDEPPIFGNRGRDWLAVGGGVAHDFSNATDGYVWFTWSRFLARNVEWIVEVGGWALDEPGDLEGGLSVSNNYRWHFINEECHSFFIDAGVGLLVATDDVPTGGTEVNFLPRLGAGATWRFGNGPQRLVVGARWHHISNARMRGQDQNPARDGLMLYAGVEFPF